MEMNIITYLVFTASLFNCGLIGFVYSRFGFKIQNQKKWVIISLSITMVNIAFTIFFMPKTWGFIFEELQIISLSTFFSGIAAIGILSQIAKKPFLIADVTEDFNSKIKILRLGKESKNKLTFFVYNASKVTAKDIFLNITFPAKVKVEKVEAPIVKKILEGGREISLQFDSDKSYNPLNPFIYTSFDVTISTTESFIGVGIIHVMAKDMPMQVKKFLITNKEVSEEITNLIKKENKWNKDKREKTFLIQKIFTLLLSLLLLIAIILFHY